MGYQSDAIDAASEENGQQWKQEQRMFIPFSQVYFSIWASCCTQLLCNSTFWFGGGPRRAKRRPEVSIFLLRVSVDEGISSMEEFFGEGFWMSHDGRKPHFWSRESRDFYGMGRLVQ